MSLITKQKTFTYKMPHSISFRQREVLEFIKNYIQKNESSPRLEEIADNFSIKPPTAHKILEALQSKGYLYFGRDKISGFFIRLIERAGSSETVMEIAIAGKIDRYGEVHDFPKELGHFATVLIGSKPDEVFSLVVTEDIPQSNMLENDFIIFDLGKKPQPGDICIAPMGKRLFLIRVTSKTYDKETQSLLLAQEYPIPEKLTKPELEQYLYWQPLAYDDENRDYFLKVAEEQRWPSVPIPPGFVAATALRLVRALAY
jgi:SOS-response transcriptional repressor LexA